MKKFRRWLWRKYMAIDRLLYSFEPAPSGVDYLRDEKGRVSSKIDWDNRTWTIYP